MNPKREPNLLVRKWWANPALIFVALLFFFSASIALRRAAEPLLTPGFIQLQLGHWQLEGGVREGFDMVIREYQEMHPNVRIRQLPIPGRVYQQWLNTRLIGGNPPDMIQTAPYHLDDAAVARYFIPLTEFLNEVNPYNAGTPLEGMAWKDTYVNGLMPADSPNVHYYSANLMEYFAIPNLMATVRMYYNRDLMEQIFGYDFVPSTYAEFLELCEKTIEFGRQQRRPLLPIAGSFFTARQFIMIMMRSQTQRLVHELDRFHTLQLGEIDALSAYLSGVYDLQTPGIQNGFSITQEVARFMQPGFLQLDREDATFAFLQSRALMITTGSWDINSLRLQANFPIGVFAVPLPDPDHPRFGQEVIGPESEARVSPALPLAVPRSSPHPEAVIDFLRFLTSQHGNTLLARSSGWPPAILGVEPAEYTRPFMPVDEGVFPGFALITIGREIARIFNNEFHRLIQPGTDVARFLDQTGPQFHQAARDDLTMQARSNREFQRAMEVTGLAWFQLAHSEGEAIDREEASRRLRMTKERNAHTDRRVSFAERLLSDL